MQQQRRKFKIFAEEYLDRYLEEKKRKIQSQIEKESEDYILTVNETEYIDYLVSEFSIDMPTIDFEGVQVTDYERKFSEREFPEQVIIYHLPCSGDIQLFRYTPNTHIRWTVWVFMEDQSLCFEIVTVNKNAREIKLKAQQTIDNMRTQLGYFTQQIESYNAQLRKLIERTFRKRKQMFLDNYHMLNSLDVPIKKREDLPQTYAIPTPQMRKSIISKPEVTTTGYTPDPTLSQSIYHEILQIIYDLGKVFERLPSTYGGKREEDLRDHLLLYLEPRFEGSATGETFNKTGKTDILIRYQNSNAFIAECKFWQGQKHYMDAITQLLGYLTWRDSKAAVVIFVRNKEFSSVLQTVEKVTPDHPNYLEFVDKEDESWFNYRFHINGDPNRGVKLAVLLFHIPP